MSQPHPFALAVTPEAVPALRAAFIRAVDRMDTALSSLCDTGYLHEAWLGDEVSERVRVHYNTIAIDGEHSAYNALTAYRDELKRIADHLALTEAGYEQTEASNAANLGS